MFSSILFAHLPLLPLALAAPSPRTSPSPSSSLSLIESLARPGYCVQIQTFNPPRVGLTVYLGACDAPSSTYAHSTFFVPALNSSGPIEYDDQLCLVPEARLAADGGRIFLGDCTASEWTVGIDGTVRTGDEKGQCLNYDAKQFKLQTYACYPTGEDQAMRTSPLFCPV